LNGCDTCVIPLSSSRRHWIAPRVAREIEKGKSKLHLFSGIQNIGLFGMALVVLLAVWSKFRNLVAR